ncbi:type II toxin-antitoxin system MqsR family toxin [uncultured Dubosiella sp.]|uniref:type II toxin-antitoxin system MqsR family toxin n=1 Tax=uncultured Dubosiella sp. TaxID=1937011 RepID=UPI0025B58555|nr:type II toxin-antitoxin system MqsR family toxin [uncultured Dubosiella sp.]
MNIKKNEIDSYLKEVKEAIGQGRYRIAQNRNRKDNNNLFLDYVIDLAKAKEILLELTSEDFCQILRNEHQGFEQERLYVFGKDVQLLPRFQGEEVEVSLYIKINKLDNCYVIVVSFHEQKFPNMKNKEDTGCLEKKEWISANNVVKNHIILYRSEKSKNK